MKLTITRSYKKSGYTIGRLYVNGTFLCNTLEPTDRGLVNTATPGHIATEEWQTANTLAKREKALHKPGTTAIPTGLYRVELNHSKKFHAQRPFLRHVPGFDGIMIHEGNTPANTLGCILVGENTIVGRVQNSQYHLKQLLDRLLAAKAAHEVIILRIS